MQGNRAKQVQLPGGLGDEGMDAGGRATQGAVAEGQGEGNQVCAAPHPNSLLLLLYFPYIRIYINISFGPTKDARNIARR